MFGELERRFPDFTFWYDGGADLVWAKEKLSSRKLRIGVRNEIQMARILSLLRLDGAQAEIPCVADSPDGEGGR